jgi:hypothetical protein
MIARATVASAKRRRLKRSGVEELRAVLTRVKVDPQTRTVKRRRMWAWAFLEMVPPPGEEQKQIPSG